MQDVRFHPGWEFERAVAAAYRTLGAQVQHDVSIAGNQLDLLVQERTPSGSAVRIAVECKAYGRPVGVDVINSFGGLAHLLKQRDLIDRAILVASSGFTRQARLAADAHGIELLEIADLKQRVAGRQESVDQAERLLDDEYREAIHDPTRPKKVFVVMPFAAEFEDVYILGIREVAEQLGLTVERADDIEHNENILETIQASIRDSSAVVADASTSNPNVFYEIGYAHAKERPTILLCRAGQAVPFDIRGKNMIMYTSIVDLRDRLKRRLKDTLGLT